MNSMQSLRSYLQRIEETIPDQLITIDQRVDSEYEITAHVHKMEKQTKNPALFFNNVKGYDSCVVINLFGHIDRINLAIRDSKVRNGRLDFYNEWNASIAKEISPVHVSNSPLKDVCHKGDELDLTSLPIPKFYEQDGGKYITAGLLVARNPKRHEELNLTYARMMVNGKADLGVSFHSRGHMWQYLEKSKSAGKPLDVAIIIGAHPALCLAAAAKTTDEYHITSSLMGVPLELIDCETVDLPVPSQAEIILEGKVLLDERNEGPFTEYTGYISGRSTRNHIRVDAITMRKNAILHAVAPNNSAEHLLLSGLPKQARISKILLDSMHVSALRDIIWPIEGTHLVCFLTLDERISSTPGLAKQYALLLLGLDHYVKYVAILPEGTNITNIGETLSSIASRSDFRQGSGVELLGDVFGQYLDPSSPEAGLTSKMIIDSTGPAINTLGATVEVVRKKAMSIVGVEDIAFHNNGNPSFAVIKATSDAEASKILNKLEDIRLLVIVDRDIDVDNPREVLWAIATRSQPLSDVTFSDNGVLIDTRKFEGWSAMRATLPDSVRTQRV
jgi:UbiD family decarboxylase